MQGGREMGTEGAEGAERVLCDLKNDSPRLISKNKVDFILETFGTARFVLESEQLSCVCD